MTAAVIGAAYLSTVWCNQVSERNGLFEPSLKSRNKRRRLDEDDKIRRCGGPSVAQLQHQHMSHFDNRVPTPYHTANSNLDNLLAQTQMAVFVRPLEELGEGASTSLTLQRKRPNTHVSGIGPSQPMGQAMLMNGGGGQGQASLCTGAYRCWLRFEPFRTILTSLTRRE